MRATDQTCARRAATWRQGGAWVLVLPMLLAGAGCADIEGADVDAQDIVVQTGAVTATPSALNPDKVLLVRDISVVDRDFGTTGDPARTVDPCKSTSEADANRHWTFGYLMKQMALRSGMSVSDFAAGWLIRWGVTSLVWATPDPGTVPFNPSTTLNEVIDPEVAFTPTEGEDTIPGLVLHLWRKASCMQAAGRDIEDPAVDSICPPDRVATTPLAMNKAPFRLLAIVNRPDLRKVRYFGEGNAGELRFVFQILNPMVRDRDGSGACTGLDGPGTSATEGDNQLVILEYAANKADPKAYERQWEALNTLTLNSSTYRNQLQAITDSVVNSGAAPSNVNQSALIRIRTNTTVTNSTWILREFMIATNKGLEPVEVKQTPLPQLNDHPDASNDPLLSNWVNANQTPILNQTHRVPPTYQGQRLLAFKGENLQFNTFWQMAGVSNNDVRHKLSLNTCSGCHGLETGNGSFNNTGNAFAMILARHYRQRSVISSFISGVGKDGQPYQISDPGNNNVKRSFNEFKVRQTEMWNLIYR